MGQVIDLFTKKEYTPVQPKRFFQDEALHEFSLRFKDRLEMIEAVQNHTGVFGNEICPYIGNVQLWEKYDSGFSMPIPCNIDNIHTQLNESFYILGNAKNNEPFMWMDRKYKQTLRILQYCKQKDKQLYIKTASDLIATNQYIDQLDKSWTIYIDLKTTSISMPSIQRRERAFQKLFSLGYNVRSLELAA